MEVGGRWGEVNDNAKVIVTSQKTFCGHYVLILKAICLNPTLQMFMEDQ